MNVSFVEPLRRAWTRTGRILFKPFRLRTWLVLGFAAFLSELMSGWHGGQSGWQADKGDLPERIGRIPEILLVPLFLWLAVVLVLAFLALAVVLLWVSCRGKFIFLDDVAHARAAIFEPWKRFARLGNSLFLWKLTFVIVCLTIGVLILLPFVVTIRALFEGGGFQWAALGGLLGLFSLIVPLIVVGSYILLFLSDFVVPIMYRHDLGVGAAWGRFLVILRRHPLTFVLYGLLVFALWAAVTAACVGIGFATCCVGFVLLALPYVGSVLLLPAFVTFRAFGPEFLAQFGPEYSVFPATDGARPAAEPGPPAEGGASG